jgi:hypothetical protein
MKIKSVCFVNRYFFDTLIEYTVTGDATTWKALGNDIRE